MSNLIAMKDAKSGVTEYLDQASGRVYQDAGGATLLREMEPTEYVLGDKGHPVRDGRGRMIHLSAIASAAAAHYYRRVADQVGEPVSYRVCDELGRVREMSARPSKQRLVTAKDKDTGRLVAMDLGVGDVHTAAALPNYAAGYHLTDGIADIASPVILAPKQQDVYYTWNSDSDFKRKLPSATAPGAAVAEVNPTLGPATYSATEYALAGFLPTEIQANADTPLRPFSKLAQVVTDALRLEREIRVSGQLQTSGSFNAALVTTLAAGAQWNGGAASDPVLNLHHAIEQSYLPVTGILWSELVEHDFLRNPAVQKYFTFKDMVDGIPDPMKVSSTLRLPPIHTAMMKYVTGAALTYVWGNHVVLVHQPAQNPPTDQMDVATASTFRWTGGEAPDGTLTAGLLVRTYYDPKRGARGGTQIVVAHNDAEQMTSGLVGGLLLNAHI